MRLAGNVSRLTICIGDSDTRHHRPCRVIRYIDRDRKTRR